MTSLLTRPLRLIAVIAVLGIAAGAYWVWNGVSSSTAADQTDAVAEFRAKGVSDAAPAPGAPAPGVYTFRTSGSESAGSGVLSASRPLPPEAIYIVTPIAGGYHEDLRISEEHVEEARFSVSEVGTSATWRRTKITFLGIGEDDRSDVTPAALDHPATLPPGRSWKGRYSLGDIDVSYRGRVVGAETAQVDGASVPVVVIRTDARFSGSTTGTRTDVVRWAPSVNLPVTWSIDQKTGGEADYSISADLELVSTTPVR